jgi:holo-[acyl-carrier protein] synthase
MKIKIGTDIIAISRMQKSLEKYPYTFKERFLSHAEIQMATKIESIAGYWAAKEAIAKALGCGIGARLSFHDIILSKDSFGAPSFSLSPQAQQRHQIVDSALSISHDGGFAIAVSIIHQST